MSEYSDLKQKKNSQTAELATIKPNFGLIFKDRGVSDLVLATKQSSDQLETSLLVNEELLTGLSAEKRQEWLALVDEAKHAVKIIPRRRTLSAKKTSVLQENRFPTASAKFHQATLEQAVAVGAYQDKTFELKETKVRLEKLMYRYNKLRKEVDENPQADNFIKEKNLELMEIKIVKNITALNGILTNAEQHREEIREWSILKEGLYAEAMQNREAWSPDSVDGENGEGWEEVALARRHLSNFVILKKQPTGDGGDISSVLNIEGLCLTAITSGIKSGKLGLILKDLGDDQIDLIWHYLFAAKSEIARQPGQISVKYGTQTLVFVTEVSDYKMMRELARHAETQTVNLKP